VRTGSEGGPKGPVLLRDEMGSWRWFRRGEKNSEKTIDDGKEKVLF
jgi:hypothetical protein